jgi:hypothetical protein
LRVNAKDVTDAHDLERPTIQNQQQTFVKGNITVGVSGGLRSARSAERHAICRAFYLPTLYFTLKPFQYLFANGVTQQSIRCTPLLDRLLFNN